MIVSEVETRTSCSSVKCSFFPEKISGKLENFFLKALGLCILFGIRWNEVCLHRIKKLQFKISQSNHSHRFFVL
jgi:hypothetical protein